MNWYYPLVFWLIPAAFLLIGIAVLVSLRSLVKLQTIASITPVWRLRIFLRYVSMAAFLILTIFALAEPRGGREAISAERSGVDIAVIFDISRSMLAADISPSRLERGSAVLGHVISSVESARFSLIPFKGEAVPIIPMTEDRIILDLWIKRLGPALSSAPGTNIEKALSAALSTFPPDVGRNRIMLIFSDGEALSGRVERLSRELSAQGIPVHAVLTGTEEGAPIPLGNGSNLLDESDSPVLSRANQDVLWNLSEDTSGSFHNLSLPGAVSGLIQSLEQERDFAESRGIRFKSIYQFRTFLLPAVLMLLLYFLIGIIPWPEHLS